MKIEHDGLSFDSEQEVMFYDKLKSDGATFVYQNVYKSNPIKVKIGRRRTYTPDFIVYKEDEKIIDIIELKGYAKWSANEDNNIMDFMKYKAENEPDFLIDWLKENKLYKEDYKVEYHRLKHIKSFGFVDYNFKNPNNLLNKRKNKIKELEERIKVLEKFKKDTIRFLELSKKEKLNKNQKNFLDEYLKEAEEGEK